MQRHAFDLDYERRPPPRKDRLGTMLFLGLILGMIFLSAALLLPSTHRTGCGGTRIKCGSNLRQIGLGVRQYAIDDVHYGRYPPSLEVLLENSDLLVPETFICPSDLGVNPAPPPFVLGVNTSYTYLGNGLTDRAGSSVVLGHCHPMYHRNEGANVLFADGSVQFVANDELAALLASP